MAHPVAGRISELAKKRKSANVRREHNMIIHNVYHPESGRHGVGSLLTTKDVAAILIIIPKTDHKLVSEGNLACVRVTAQDPRFTKSEHRRIAS
jgi:hypothetical protein